MAALVVAKQRRSTDHSLPGIITSVRMVSKLYFSCFLYLPSCDVGHSLLSYIHCSDVPECGCCTCFGGGRVRRSSKVTPDQEPNFSALFDDEHSRYFRIKEALPKNTVNVGKFIAMGTAYSIVEMLDFVGWHLPLKHSHSAHTFQSIITYFSEFERGVDKIQDPHRVMMGFGMIHPLRHLLPH